MPLTDVAYNVVCTTPLTANADGADLDVRAGGAYEGLKQGMVVQALLRVGGAIDDTTGNETMQIFIEEKIGSAYRVLSSFPIIGGTLDDNPDVDVSGKLLTCFFQMSPNATHLRYRALAGGTTPSVAGAIIDFHPLSIGKAI